MFYAKRVDGNQRDVVEVLRKGGCTVVVTSGVGSLGGNLAGFPDLVVKGVDKLVYLIEIKDGGKKLTDAEKDFANRWDTNGNMVVVIRSVDEAVQWMNDCLDKQKGKV
ncbi:MAG: hypothetical protein QF704_00070 [Anaerolineales bacterium]|jgi:hypothetical protein|nr:hypothetical protein [Anaerolineales bacterium]